MPAPTSSRIPTAAKQQDAPVALAPGQCRDLLDALAQITAELALKRTLGREYHAYPAPAARQPPTEQQADPGRSLPLLAVLPWSA